MAEDKHGFGGTPVTIRTPWGDELTVLQEDASHYGDVLESGVKLGLRDPLPRAVRRAR